MQFTSLNQILNLIQAICQNHAQINSYTFGSESDISASTQEQYPLVWVDVENSSIQEKTLLINLSILVADIQKADQSNEQDTLSDTLSIAQDIYAALNNPTYQDYFNIVPSVNIEVMREGLPDFVNGFRMAISFELEQIKDRCQIPVKQ